MDFINLAVIAIIVIDEAIQYYNCFIGEEEEELDCLINKQLGATNLRYL